MSEPSDDDRDAPAKPPAGKAPARAKDDREARLAAALRANLRRRKAAAPKPPPKAER
jgi:hypothetical protein